MLDSLLAGSLNHLVKQNQWAIHSLQRHAGKQLKLNLFPFAASLTILQSGYFHEDPPKRQPHAVAKLSAPDFLRLASTDFQNTSLIQVEGDVDFAVELLKILRELRWDAAEDLSRLAGDVVAERVVQLSTSLLTWQKTAAKNLSATWVEYLTEEQSLLAPSWEIRIWLNDTAALRDRVECLEKRISRIAAQETSE